MRHWLKTNSNKINAWVIGLGLILFIIHNPNQPMMTYAFLPVVGLLLSLFGCLSVLMPKSGERKNLWGGFYWEKPIWDVSLGRRWIYVPLLLIVGSIAISGFVNGATLGEKVAPLFFGCYLFMVYLASRKLGKEIFVPFAVFVVIEAISCVVQGMMVVGERAGGIVGWYCSNPTGGLYAIAVRLLVFGSMVSIFKRQKLLICVALVGLFFTGSEEAIFAVVILGLALLIRRDWSKRLLIPLALLIVFVSVATPLGITQKLMQPTINYCEAIVQLPDAETVEEQDATLNAALNNRWTHYKTVVENIKPFGHGYNITHFYVGIPHNVPLIIVDQVGILAALAWLFVIFYCLVKTRWKYAFIAVLSLSLFDHAIWTQAAPWWWCLVGVASSSKIKSDLLFKTGLTTIVT